MKTISESRAKQVLAEGAESVTEADIQEVITRADDIQSMFSGHSPLGRFMNDMKIMISLIKDFWNKNYREVPWWTISAIVTALLYVLNPFDIVPDFVPFVGLLDDAAVISACLFLAEKDLKKYRNWKHAVSTDKDD